MGYCNPIGSAIEPLVRRQGPYLPRTNTEFPTKRCVERSAAHRRRRKILKIEALGRLRAPLAAGQDALSVLETLGSSDR
jgi:hypothetical protein